MTPILTLREVSKAYGPTVALDRVSVEFAPGEVHAVLGENGAGKSTLMNIIAGFVAPDSGEGSLREQPLPFGRSFEARRRGIAMVHQHFALVPAFTSAENLALAHLRSPWQGHRPDRDAAPALKLAEQLGWKVDPDAPTEELPVGVQQRLEILKALSGDAEVVIFDEPTAVLTPDEVEDLFRVIRELKARGRTIILIAHKLSEVMAIADRVTVLRRGAFVASADIKDVDADQLATWMVGEVPASRTPARATFEAGLRVTDLHVRGNRGEHAVRGVSLTIGKGEILGIGGVDGNGQVELAETLARVRPAAAGSIYLVGCDLEEASIAYIPQDRQSDGLALSMSIRDNLLITGHRRRELTFGPLLRRGAIERWTRDLVERFQIKVGSVRDPVSSLSGGNQQKVVVARSLDVVPDLLVAVNPTRGLDVRATDYVHSQIVAAAEAGAVVALFSTDLDELAALAHRTVFLSRGQLADRLVGGDS